MKLVGITIQGVKRFRAKSFLRVNSKLSALVGPNEVGKTTLLKAIELIDTSNPFPESLRSRGYEGDVYVEALFDLDERERADLGVGVPQGVRVRRDIGSDSRRWILDPLPEPDLDKREGLRGRVIALTAELSQRVADGTEGIDLGEAQRSSEILGSRGILDEGQTDEISEFIETVEKLEINDDGLAEDLRRHIASSSQSLIDEQLERHAPRFLYFGPRESDLIDEYPIRSLESAGQHPALENLAQLVDLDLRRLFQFASRGDPAAAVRPLQRANERLMTAFEDVWTQHNVALSLTGDFRNIDSHLQIFVGEPDREFYKPSDWSAGLRWFVALYAFLMGAHGPMPKPPVLLVDEADIHLHYDAQADLVREMMQQRLTAEVIYTTHSAGCLPADLSNVRVIEPVEGGWSEIHNKFWAHADARISSLIIRMGASSFAFTRSRSAIATEGPSDYLLLPSILRYQDQDFDRRSVQVVPALASVPPSQIAELDREAGRVVYLTDNDEAGKKIRADLQSEGIDPSRILSLPAEVVEIEDLIAKRALADACGRIAVVVGETVKVNPGDIPDTARGKYLQALMSDWKQEPTKVDLAEFLLDSDQSIIDRGRIGAIRDLHKAITSALT